MEPQDASTEVAAPRMKSPDRTQIDPNPKRIDDLIPPGHKARLVWELVLNLDLSPLYAQIKAVEGHAGRPPTDPRVLVALWLYATDEGISKARELYRRCNDCDPYKWLRGGVDVNYHTLSDFRTQPPEWPNAASLRSAATKVGWVSDPTRSGQSPNLQRCLHGASIVRPKTLTWRSPWP